MENSDLELRKEIADKVFFRLGGIHDTDKAMNAIERIYAFVTGGKVESSEPLCPADSERLERAYALVYDRNDILSAMREAKVIASFWETGKTLGLDDYKTKMAL